MTFTVTLETDDGDIWTARCGEDWAQAPSAAIAVNVLVSSMAARHFGKRTLESKQTLKALGFAPKKPAKKKAKRRK